MNYIFLVYAVIFGLEAGRFINIKSCRVHFVLPLIEAANMIGWTASVYVNNGNPAYALILCAAVSAGICISVSDIRYMIIPDRSQIVLFVLGVLSVFFDESTVWYSHLTGLAVGFICFFAIGWVSEHFTGKDSLGGGDIKLAASMGLILGAAKLLKAVMIASVGACIVILISGAVGKKERSGVYPFAPFLVTGLIITVFL